MDYPAEREEGGAALPPRVSSPAADSVLRSIVPFFRVSSGSATNFSLYFSFIPRNVVHPSDPALFSPPFADGCEKETLGGARSPAVYHVTPTGLQSRIPVSFASLPFLPFYFLSRSLAFYATPAPSRGSTLNYCSVAPAAWLELRFFC